ncbi:tRNA (N(6)-L-threonylcarbamoyladenosine(37)-C(2))-methylthiotransferase MtaB [Caldilinea sp.]|uniref:tRNA (N(6)-L-threonylcarbamoyladenosine(37)-C(2))- methylthiotransferase MtaB n=1 Tax=Caldilinea sp. TaxID=2293560 RepID=UPI0021DDF3F8|nr:tRNA (N(6)-L-threonylcarbamoyladenosine(37)-C(2))-methylthiotransferase MtaB [Caldilinea sp.]GIV68648.1 MAG: tRNA (N(6)-L-threonylcarbamoyladenosine(37)-C(2))-methylthiotransferase MtaB [Caldilinea sp.]
MRIFVDQIGCRLNFSEMETLAGRLAAVGHTIVAEPEAAQVIVFNSCAVTAGAERDSRKRVAALHRASPAARIAVTGCWATLRPRQAAQLPGVTLVADNSRKEMLATLLEPWSAELDDPDTLARMQPDGVPFVGPAGSNGSTRRTRAFIKVQDGCNNRCTFCIVTTLRGESRSRPLREVITEVQRLAEAGVMEAVLTGVHLGSYGRDLPGAQRSDLKELVAALLTDTAIPRLRLSSLEPWELAEGFFDLWAQWPGRLCPHLHLPLQAGTDRQLRAMARRCTTASFRRLVQEARAAIPDLILTTDLIVGFPGESERDFEEGLAFVEEMRFAHAHLFPFSPREGTAAARFPDQVPTEVKRARLQRMQQVVAATGQAERARFLGTTRPVLFEGEGRPLADQEGRLWFGLTDNYLRVSLVAPAHLDLHNQLLPVRLTAIEGEIIHGELPEHRM